MAAALSTGALRVLTESKAVAARRLRDWNGPLGGCARLLTFLSQAQMRHPGQ